jgi:hypothetical protein
LVHVVTKSIYFVPDLLDSLTIPLLRLEKSIFRLPTNNRAPQLSDGRQSVGPAHAAAHPQPTVESTSRGFCPLVWTNRLKMAATTLPSVNNMVQKLRIKIALSDVKAAVTSMDTKLSGGSCTEAGFAFCSGIHLQYFAIMFQIPQHYICNLWRGR